VRRELGRNALHLAVLSSFAFAEPLFDLLGRTPEFFVVRGSTASDVVVLALVLTLVPPLAGLVLEAGAALVSARALRALHLVLVAALAAVIALQIVRRALEPTAPALLVSAAAGAAFALIYARGSVVRTFVSVLLPVPLVFCAIFLFRAPLGALEGTAKALTIPPPKHAAPVVLVVLDEFAEDSLLDGSRGIDAVRFPNFAALARTSTWYRAATSVHEHTPDAVPAILTGQDPKVGALPVAQDHPDNIFTLLGKSYRMNVYESVTQLCPQTLCARRRDSFGDRLSSLADDLEVVYGHLVLPKRLEDRLASVTDTWQGFSAAEHDDTAALARANLVLKGTGDVDREIGRQMWQDQRFISDRWVSGLQPSPAPTLYLTHLLLPHYPWRYLPDGKQYGNSLGIDGLDSDGDTWTSDPWVVEQGWQRHLLQVGFTDRLFGTLIATLKARGIWDKALVIVAADHGVSFRPGAHRRNVTAANFSDIAAVPLFVKLPHQRRGRIDDGAVETVDIVPTIAQVLGITLPYHVDGRSLLKPHGDRQVVVRGAKGSSVAKTSVETERGRDATLRRQLALFGSGTWSRVYAIGPHRNLLGRSVGSLRVVSGSAHVSVDGQGLLAAVDLRSLLSPSHVTGSVSGAPAGTDLAIAIDGRIAAMTQTFATDGSVHFAAFVPETAFRQGANELVVYIVRGGGLLERLHGGTGAATAYRLVSGGIVDPAGRRITLVPGALAGRVEDWYFESGSVRFGGWAGDATRHALADAVLVFRGKQFLYAGTTTVKRKLRPLRAHGVIQGGFVIELPDALVGRGGGPPLRFFAVRGDVATELPVASGFPWREA
jgi:Sulfatase